METIGSLIERLQGLISRSFLIAAFIPALVFLAINTVMMYWVFPGLRQPLGMITAFMDAKPVIFWLAVVVFLFVFALALWSLNAWFRQFLEGNYLPLFIADIMVASQYRWFRAIVKHSGELLEDLVWYRESNKPDPTAEQRAQDPGLEKENKYYKTRLSDARRKGLGIPVTDADKTIDKKLLKQYNRLKRKQLQWKKIAAAEMNSFFKNLEAELAKKDANKIPQLDVLHQQALQLFEDALSKMQSMETKLYYEQQSRFPTNLARLGPTQMANFTAVHREYGLRRYGLEIEYFWLRLLKIIKADTDFYPLLEEAKTQLDFSVISTTLLGVTTFVWLPLSFAGTPEILPYAVIAVAGIPVTSLFYNTAVQNYKTFVEAVRSAIDLHRFDLLKALHIGLPADSLEEVKTWLRVYKWPDPVDDDTAPIETAPIQYKHGDETGQPAPEAKESKSFFQKFKNWFGFK